MHAVVWTAITGKTGVTEEVEDWKKRFLEVLENGTAMRVKSVDGTDWPSFALRNASEIISLAKAYRGNRTLLAQQLLGFESVFKARVSKDQSCTSLLSAVGVRAWAGTIRSERHAQLGRAFFEKAIELAADRGSSGPPVIEASEWIRPRDIDESLVAHLLKCANESLFGAFSDDTARGVWNDVTADGLPHKTLLFAVVYGPQLRRTGLTQEDIAFQIELVFPTKGQPLANRIASEFIASERPELPDSHSLVSAAIGFRSRHTALLPMFWTGRHMTAGFELAQDDALEFKHRHRKESADGKILAADSQARDLGRTFKKMIRGRTAKRESPQTDLFV